ncbi:unnamed protein product [Trichogramma brassicae]|uniref:Uncharacterized protein n=1 Tax=Trichogramma brassicae TaxID=86971 RepID=A0A6H5I4K1_9HYME|nr:unnamed protein product [Trichogramma brassicae]
MRCHPSHTSNHQGRLGQDARHKLPSISSDGLLLRFRENGRIALECKNTYLLICTRVHFKRFIRRFQIK